MNTYFKTSLGFLFTLILSTYSFGQINIEKVLEGYFIPEIIKKNKLQSVMLYVDINEDDIHKRGSYSGKTMEAQFNENGFPTYHITNHNNGFVPFIEYGSGSFITLYEYDKDNHITNKYTEDYRRTIEEQNSYDALGNKISTTYIDDKDTVLKTGFEWKKGEMVKATALFANKTNQDRINQFDEKGRILSAKSGSYEVNYQYKQIQDTLYTTIKTILSDTLYSMEKVSTFIPNNYIIRYLKTDHANKLRIDMHAQLDQFGNATYYYLNDLTQTYHGNKTYPPTTYEIKNEYNAQNLLTKRMFYYSRGDVGERLLTKIEKYFFDTAPLPFTLKKGSVVEQIQTEEMMDR